MSKLILSLVILMVVIFNIYKLKSKVSISTFISFTVFNLAFNLIISILIFYKSAYSDYLIYLAITLVVSLVYLLFSLNKASNIDNDYLITTSFNSLVITIVLQYLIFLALKITNNMFFVYQILGIIIIIGLYIGLHILLAKTKYSKLIYSDKLDIGRLLIVLVFTIVISLFTVIDEPYSPRYSNVYLQDVSDSDDFILIPKIKVNEITKITKESVLVDYSDEYIRQYYLTSEYIYTVVDKGDLGVSLIAYNINSKTESVIFEVESSDSLKFNYINLTSIYKSSFQRTYVGDIYITTPYGLYYLDGEDITTLYENQINEGDIQFLDYNSVLYYEYVGTNINDYVYNYYYFDSNNLYSLENQFLELIDNDYSFSFLETKPDSSISYSEKFPFSWSGDLDYIFNYDNQFVMYNSETDRNPDRTNTLNDLFSLYNKNNTFNEYFVLEEKAIYFDNEKSDYIEFDSLDEKYIINSKYPYLNHIKTSDLYTSYWSTNNNELLVIYSFSRDDFSPIISINTIEIEHYTINNYQLQYQSKAFYIGIVLLFIPFVRKKRRIKIN